MSPSLFPRFCSFLNSTRHNYACMPVPMLVYPSFVTLKIILVHYLQNLHILHHQFKFFHLVAKAPWISILIFQLLKTTLSSLLRFMQTFYYLTHTFLSILILSPCCPFLQPMFFLFSGISLFTWSSSQYELKLLWELTDVQNSIQYILPLHGF